MASEGGRRSVCIVGGSGQIGERLIRAFAARGWSVVATHCRTPRPGTLPLDACDANQVRALISRLRPGLLVNSLNAPGGTDACEDDPALAQRLHLDTARHLIDAAAEVGSRFVQISTDYVFDGRGGPYREDAVPAPLSQLGRAKLEAERYALARAPGSLVLRTSFVFSWAPQTGTKNFVMQRFDQDRRGEAIRVPNDQVGNVTYAPNFAEALVELVEAGASGIYHVAGTTRCSKYEWALRVAEFFGMDRRLIHGVSTAELNQRGPRPRESGFRLEKAQAALKRTRLMSLDEGLADLEEEMALVQGARQTR